MNLANTNTLLLGLLGFFFLVSMGLLLLILRERRDARFEKLLLEQKLLNHHGKLSCRITHEIGNPLSVIRSASNELLQNIDDEIVKQDLAQILIGVERVSRIVDNARNYLYRKEGLEKNIIDLKKLVDNVLLFYSQILETYDIELYLKNLDSIYIEGDSGKLEQLLLDLVGTSIDEIEKLPEKWIEISALEANNHVSVRVKNSGHGLPKAVEKKIKSWFLTSDKRGHVHYMKEPHTTFTMDLPVADDHHHHHS